MSQLGYLASNGKSIVVAQPGQLQLEREKVLAEEKLATSDKPKLTMEESFEHRSCSYQAPGKYGVILT
jgi:hypothetical protein